LNIVWGLHHCCSAWLASVGPSPLYFTAFKTVHLSY
jgi:hypothetical protein